MLKKALEIYADIAEGNGQDGDMFMFEEMMTEHEIVSKFCTKLETEYVQYQTIHSLQLHILFNEEGENVYKSVNNIVEVYYNNLESEIEKIKEKQTKLNGIKGVIEAINP